MENDNDTSTGAATVTEMIEQDEHAGKRALVQAISAILIAIGLLFTGYLNFSLYSRAFTDDLKVMGLIPALLIEGSLATFLLGSFVWFAAGTQGMLSKVFAWAMFAIVALNSLVEFNALTGNVGSNDFIRLYSTWGVPVVIPLVIGFWKAVYDADPTIKIMRQKRKIIQTLQLAKMSATLVALDDESSRNAMEAYGLRSAGEINRRLRGDGQAKSIGRRNGHVPETTVMAAGDQPEGVRIINLDVTEAETPSPKAPPSPPRKQPKSLL